VSGNTGSVVASTLLAKGQKVRVLVRSEDKGAQWKQRGADVAVASLDNAAQLSKALTGVQGAFLLVPPDLKTTELLARGQRFVAAMKEALQSAAVPHVVFLSSGGAQHADGTGPIRSLHHAEQTLAGGKTAATWVRAALFMENLANYLYPLREQSILPVMSDPDMKLAMVATQDIGETCAQALVEGPSATPILELAGPQEWSYDDAAKLFGNALGKAITVVQVPDAGIVPALLQAGLSSDVAELFREMQLGLGSGRVAFQGGPQVRSVRGKVTLEAYIKGLLAATGGAST
jgi:uncharacterized protein YbjT (DUF2867 family)